MDRSNHLSTLLVAYSLLLLPVSLHGQNGNGDTPFRFEEFELPNGILGNHLQCIVQDSFGFMWFGSQNGIHRWDGYQFKTYTHDPLDSTSISSSYVESMYVARDGSLWLGTIGQGLNRFDPGTEQFTTYLNDPDDPRSLSSNFITDIIEDSEGHIWLTTTNGLNRLNRSTGKFKRYYYDPNDVNSLSYDKATCLYVDSAGTLWVGTGWAWETEELGGLNRYDPETDSFFRFQHDPDDPQSLISDKVFDLYEDSAGNFWVVTDGDGLHLMDRKDGTFFRLKNTPAREGKISAPYTGDEKTSEHVKFIFEDKEQNIWIGAWQAGLKYYNPKTGDIQFFHRDSDHSSTVPDNYLWDMFQSKDGTLWGFTAGTGASVFKIIRSEDAFSKVVPSSATSIKSFYQEENGTLWMGTSRNGLYRVNAKQGDFQVLTSHSGQWQDFQFDDGDIYTTEEGNPLYGIHRIAKDKEGYFWFLSGLELGPAKNKQLIRYHPETEVFIPVTYDKEDTTGLSGKYIVDILADHEGYIWVFTSDGVLNRYDPKTSTFSHYRPDYPLGIQDEDNSYFLNGVLQSGKNGRILLAGKRGDDFFSSTGLFLYEFRVETGRFKEYPLTFKEKDTWVDDLVLANDGMIWVVTRYAIIGIDPVTGYSRYLEMNELGTSFVLGMVIDEQGFFWILGDALIAYDQKQKSSFIFDGKSGIDVLPFNMRSIYKGPSGQVFMGGRLGAQYFYPNDLKRTSPVTSSPVIISDFSQPGKYPAKKGNVLMKASSQDDPVITLNHNENDFTFRFAVLDFFRPENNQHEYRLDGYDKGWRKSGLEPMANYTKVPPGPILFAYELPITWEPGRRLIPYSYL